MSDAYESATRANAAMAVLTMNAWERVNYDWRVWDFLLRIAYGLKALLCIAMGWTDYPGPSLHYDSLPVAYWAYSDLYAGWECAYLEVGGGWGCWWVEIGTDGDWDM